MCFKVTLALREFYHYCGVSAELERRGYGSSRPELCWANRQKPDHRENAADNQNERVTPEPLKVQDSNALHPAQFSPVSRC